MTEEEHYVASAITLGVGGVSVRFESAEPDLRMRVTFPRTRFVCDNGVTPDSVLRVRYGDPDPGSSAPRFVSGGTWEVHEGALGGDRTVFYTAVAGGGRAPMTRLELTPDLMRGELIIGARYAPENVLEVGFPLDEHVTARLMARRQAVIVHASSIVENDGAYVFIGHSGAGKSTISAIAERSGMRVLSDDRTVLALRDGTVFAAGTPWHGSQLSGRAEAVPVRAIFLLEQADEDQFIELDPSRAFAEVVVRSVRPFANAAEQALAIETIERIVGTLRAAVLRFRPTAAALGVARDFATM